MTREEAIKFGKRVLSLSLFDETHEFCELAVKALEQDPCDKYIKEIDHLRNYISKLETQIVEQEPCEDAISRKAAYEIVDNMLMGERDHKSKALDEIKFLPSVTPAPKPGRWVESESCKGCPNICIMYDPNMKGCKDKMKGVEE